MEIEKYGLRACLLTGPVFEIHLQVGASVILLGCSTDGNYYSE